MKITTKDIIKILPFEEQFKKNLLDQFDQFDPDQKFTIEQVIWDTYDGFYRLKLEENIELALLAAKENKEKLDEQFYARVRELTERDIQTNLSSGAALADLTSTREKLQQIINKTPS